ncbi:MAG TPA: hemerythrin domain-containing protein [Acidimicrobiales bacterium]|nr:hemerythrin domain-containing protein [Acidimicrobiales bacterium]
MPDALAVLAEDHRHVLELLERLLDRDATVGSHAVSESAAGQLAIAASKHEAVEERCLWPLVRARLERGDELAEQAIEQEETGKKLLHELEHTPPGPDLAAVVTRLDRALRQHIAFEEGEVWPVLRLAVGEDELDALGTRLEQAGRVAPTRPHPHSPSNPRLLGAVGPAVGALDRARDAVSGRGSDGDARGRVLRARLAVALPLAAVVSFVVWRLFARGRRPGAAALDKVAGEAALAELVLRNAADAARAQALEAARGAVAAAGRGVATTRASAGAVSSAAHHVGSAVQHAGSIVGSASHDTGAVLATRAHGMGSALGSGAKAVRSKLRR